MYFLRSPPYEFRSPNAYSSQLNATSSSSINIIFKSVNTFFRKLWSVKLKLRAVYRYVFTCRKIGLQKMNENMWIKDKITFSCTSLYPLEVFWVRSHRHTHLPTGHMNGILISAEFFLWMNVYCYRGFANILVADVAFSYRKNMQIGWDISGNNCN